MLFDVSRAAAGLKPPTTRSTFALAGVEALVIHYSTGEELGQLDPLKWWRSIQAFHMGPERNWSDVGYAFGIHARDPRVMEGRGAGVYAAHSPGWNGRSISLCVLGDDDPEQDVLEPVRARIVQWRDDCYRLLGRTVPVLGHRDTQKSGYTACPGNELDLWIKNGMPLVGKASAAVNSPTLPAKTSTPAWYVRPLKLGDRGPDVRKAKHNLHLRIDGPDADLFDIAMENEVIRLQIKQGWSITRRISAREARVIR